MKLVDYITMVLVVLFLAIAMFGFNARADLVLGIGAHNMSDDAFYDHNDDIKQENPVGVIRYEFVIAGNEVPLEGFCEHVSSIPNGHDKGLNMCGIQVRFK